jgi:hypothetical protein
MPPSPGLSSCTSFLLSAPGKAVQDPAQPSLPPNRVCVPQPHPSQQQAHCLCPRSRAGGVHLAALPGLPATLGAVCACRLATEPSVTSQKRGLFSPGFIPSGSGSWNVEAVVWTKKLFLLGWSLSGFICTMGVKMITSSCSEGWWLLQITLSK